MPNFVPIGNVARWRTIYDLLRASPIDSIVTYQQMADSLGLDPDQDRHAIQMAVRRAAREHEQVDKRAVDVVPNEGYRIVKADEHLELAQRYQRRSNRALRSGHSKASNVDLNAVDDPEVRQALQIVAQAFAMQMDFNRRMDVRQRRLEESVQAVTEQHQRSTKEIADLRSRLERLESGS